MQKLFRAYSEVIASEIALPGAPPAPQGAPSFWVTLEPEIEAPSREEGAWPHVQWAGERPALLYRPHADGHTLHIPQCGRFEVSRDGRSVRATPFIGASRAELARIVFDQVLPLSLSVCADRLVFHAAAVNSPWGVIGLVGRSGQGKSTAATSLARLGFALLADDCLVLRRAAGRFEAQPSYPGVRLWPDSAVSLLGDAARGEGPGKLRLSARRVVAWHDRAAPLAALLFLGRETAVAAPAITPIRVHSTIPLLLQHAFRLERFGESRAGADFEAHAVLAAAVPIARLTLPNDLAALAEVPAVLSRWLEACLGARP